MSSILDIEVMILVSVSQEILVYDEEVNKEWNIMSIRYKGNFGSLCPLAPTKGGFMTLLS